jgi:hypothetical protein
MMQDFVAIKADGTAIGAMPETARHVEMVEGVVAAVAPTSGRLQKGVEPLFEIRVGGRTLEARRAASCLLAPAAGDRIVAAISGDEVFVLGVLERSDRSASAIELGHGVTIDVDESQSVSIRGAGDLHLHGSRSVTATSEEVRIHAGRASLIAKKVEAVGLSLESSFDHVRQLGRVVEILADEVSSRLKRSFRFVSEIDQTRAHIVDVRAEGHVNIHGENTSVTARQIAKIDSNQIHIG